MIAADHVTPGQGRCIGFATFCERLGNDRNCAGWFERIEAGIVRYADSPEQGSTRLSGFSDRLSDLAPVDETVAWPSAGSVRRWR
jgi:hypothetical protein